MQVQKLHITNFRGFTDLTFEPPADLAVLIGVNGSGKSTVLDALAILLSQYPRYLSDATINDFSFVESDIHIDSQESHLSLDANAVYSDSLYRWEETKYRPNKQSVPKKDFTDDELFAFVSKGVSVEQLPVLAYYQTNRTTIRTSLSDDKTSEVEDDYLPISQGAAYKHAFSEGTSSFRNFFDWFEREESYENEVRLRQDANFKDPSLEAIRLAIQTFLSQFIDVDFRDLRIVRQKGNLDFRASGRLSEPILVIDKDDHTLPLNQLSSGEKTLLMLVFDIARRLAILNVTENETRTKKVLSGAGVVLIDEIDLHLHPAWQRVVIPGLCKTFPNCQFIVTTHSPQVLSKVSNKNVFVLEDGQIWPADSTTLGRDSNAILAELMGVSERPIETKREIDACLQLIDDGHLEQAEAAVDELERTLGRFDTEVVRARTLIGFLSRRADEEN